MPWNDTAQLDLLNPEAREAVIRTILDVARRFHIIRFDAAMTLAKRHYQRLWFPEPGTGGDIASRAEHGVTKAQFDAAMPVEFWREVVDRVQQEVPDTLLLAEAFWLMEGYFVRTLGMHRVYNSAFMNMLKTEDNAKYRLSIRNVLEFDPEILKRFVNFMNNPDEDTAVAQFGKDDKYFGVCMLMVTMPGLPMFGHGQVEGFTEKYGMEYRRAYRDEQPDRYLIERHEREIFPLMHRRHIFAEAQNFLLYDLVTHDGSVNENVFAYSNRAGDEAGLVVYNNKFEHTAGTIRLSVGFSQRTGQDDERTLVRRTLGDGLGLQPGARRFCTFRDHISGLEFIRSNASLIEHGLYVELDAYKYHVFMDFREVEDDTGDYANLTAYLDGRGVPSIEDARQELYLQPVRQPLMELLNPGMLRRLWSGRVLAPGDHVDEDLLGDAENAMTHALREICRFSTVPGDAITPAKQARRELDAALRLPVLGTLLPVQPAETEEAETALPDPLAEPGAWGTLLAWWVVHGLGRVTGDDNDETVSRSWIDEWRLSTIIVGVLRDLGASEMAANDGASLVKLLTSHQQWARVPTARQAMLSLLRDTEVQQWLQVNRYQDILWFNKETFQRLVRWLALIAVVTAYAESDTADQAAAAVAHALALTEELLAAEGQSGYQIDRLLAALR